MPRIIISGGPGSGKSTLLVTLKTQGYTVSEEVSRPLIRELVLNNSDFLPWKNMAGFAKLALKKMIEDYEKAPQGELTFFDIIAYLKVSKLPVPAEYDLELRNHPYHSTIFIAPPWKEIYVNDDERWQTFEESVLLHNGLMNTYQNAGYEIVTLPLANPHQRADFILEHLKDHFAKLQ
jgi:predicted ATPase